MSGAVLSGFHAQAARLSALANSVSSSDSEDDVQGEEFRAAEYVRSESEGSSEAEGGSESDVAYRANTEAFDAGADIWAMLSVIQRD